MTVIRRPQFLADVEDAADFLWTETEDEALVERWQKAIGTTIQLLEQFPELGRARADFPIAGIRTFFVKGFAKWLIFYRVERDQVDLLRVKHGMMHLPALLQDESGDP